MANKPTPKNFSAFCAIIRNKLNNVANVSTQVYRINEDYLKDNEFQIGIFDLGNEKVTLVTHLVNLKPFKGPGAKREVLIAKDNVLESDKGTRYLIADALPLDKFPEFVSVKAYVNYTIAHPDLIVKFELADKETAFINNEQAHELGRQLCSLVQNVRAFISRSKVSGMYFPEDSIIDFSESTEALFETERKVSGKSGLYFGEHKPKVLSSRMMKVKDSNVGFLQFHLVNFKNQHEVTDAFRNFINECGFHNVVKVHDDSLVKVNVYFDLNITVYKLGEFLKAFNFFYESILFAQNKNKVETELSEFIGSSKH